MDIGECSGIGPTSNSLSSAFDFGIGTCSISKEPLSKNLSNAFDFGIGTCSILSESIITYHVNFELEIELQQDFNIEIKMDAIQLLVELSNVNELNKMKFRDIEKKAQYKGDAFTISGFLTGYNVAGNFENFLLKFEIWDQKGNSLKKENSVSGGDDSQIKITDPNNKKFDIHIKTGETVNFANNCKAEFRIETAPGKNRKTAQTNMVFKEPHITW